jgi:hypothetical protein
MAQWTGGGTPKPFIPGQMDYDDWVQQWYAAQQPPTTPGVPGVATPPVAGGGVLNQLAGQRGNPFTTGRRPNTNPHAAFNRVVRPGHGAGRQNTVVAGVPKRPKPVRPVGR